MDYKDYEFQVYGMLVALAQRFKPMQELPSIKEKIDQIDEELQRIKTRKFRVAVVGEFRRGKSSFINALLGREILPVDALPTTATINRITYGAVPQAFLYYKDGRQEKVAIDELSQYVTKLTAQSLDYAAKIREAVVEYPSIFTQNYVDLIDTPGMNDDDLMNQVTLKQLEQIDLAIVALSVSSPLSDTECRFMVQLLESEEIRQIVVVVTKIDQIRERERAKLIAYLRQRIPEKVLEKLKAKYSAEDPIFLKFERIFLHLPLFGVCSLDALEARQRNDDELFESSGFRELNDQLPALILSGQNNSTILRATQTLRTLTSAFLIELSQFAQSLQQRQTDLNKQRQDFAELVYSQAQKMMEPVRVRLFERINQLNEEEETLTREFIAALSQVRVLDKKTIQDALRVQTQKSEQRLNLYFFSSLDPELSELASQEVQRQYLALVNQLESTLEQFAWMSEAVTKQIAELREQPLIYPAEEEFPWRWDPTPVLPLNQMLDVHLILQVRRCIKQSLDTYSQIRKRRVAAKLKQVSEQAAGYLESLVVSVYQQVQQQMIQTEQLRQNLMQDEVRESIEQLARENEALEQLFLRSAALQTSAEIKESESGGENHEQG